MPQVIRRFLLASRNSRTVRSVGGQIRGIQRSESGSFITSFGRGFMARLLEGVVNFISFSITSVFNWVMGTLQYLWFFNWNITDTEIDAQIQQSFVQIAGMLGDFTGQALGWLICGLGTTLVVGKFNPALAAYLRQALSEEAIDELAGQLAAYTINIIQISLRNIWLSLYKGTRSGIKKLFPELQGWGEEGGESWSFAGKVEDAVESIPNDMIRNYVENLLDGLWDGCYESGLVLAGAADQFYAQQALQQQVTLTQTSITAPGRDVPLEVYATPGTRVQAIAQAIATQQVIGDNEVGQYVGSGWETIRQQPLTIRLIFHFANKEKPPFNFTRYNAQLTSSEQPRKTIIWQRVSVADVNRAKVTWEAFKTIKPFITGNQRYTCKWDNGRQSQIITNSEMDAEQLFNQLAYFTDAKILDISEGKIIKRNNPATKREVQKMYPCFTAIINQYKMASGDRQLMTGAYERLQAKFPIYYETKPSTVDQQITNMLSNVM